MVAQIIIVGLGPGNPDQLSLGAWEVLQRHSGRLFLRTERHPTVKLLREKGLVYETFDNYYDTSESFQEVYRRISDTILTESAKEPLVYAVPGHPLVAEEAVGLIMTKARERGDIVEVLPAMSFMDAIYASLHINPVAGLHIIDGLRLEAQKPVPATANIITQVYNRLVASDVKLALMEVYPEEHPVTVVRAAGVPGMERIEEHPLYNIDRLDWVDYLTSLYLPPCADVQSKCEFPLDPLVDVMSRLRSDDGCPWDKEQDHRTLTKYLLEESYEVLEAIDEGDMYKICEELGDLLLQIVFHAQIARENRNFDMNDVVAGITEKMVRRHPHVFGDVSVKDSAEVLANWDQIKKTEKDGPEPSSVLAGVPRNLSALLRSAKVQSRASKVGFDWPDYRGAMDKVQEELGEVAQAVSKGDSVDVEREIGDLLFAAVNLARLLGVDAEVALMGTVNKFVRRFQYIEERARENGRDLTAFSLEELDCWWDEAKKAEK